MQTVTVYRPRVFTSTRSTSGPCGSNLCVTGVPSLCTSGCTEGRVQPVPDLQPAGLPPEGRGGQPESPPRRQEQHGLPAPPRVCVCVCVHASNLDHC